MSLEGMSFELIRSALVGRLGSFYMGAGLPLDKAAEQAARELDLLVSAARREPVAGAPADRPGVTWEDCAVDRLFKVVVNNHSNRHPNPVYDARVVKRGNRVGGRITLRAVDGHQEWVCYIDSQDAGRDHKHPQWGAHWFRSAEQIAWDERRKAAHAYLDETIGRAAGRPNRGLYTDDEVTLANILRRARGEEEL
jgi:hypothetical protein